MADRPARTRTTPVPATPAANSVTVRPVVSVSGPVSGSSPAARATVPEDDDIDSLWGADPEPPRSASAIASEPPRSASAIASEPPRSVAPIASEPPSTDDVDSEWSSFDEGRSEVRDALRSPGVPKDVRAPEPSPAPKAVSLSRPPAPEWTPAPKAKLDVAPSGAEPSEDEAAASAPPRAAREAEPSLEHAAPQKSRSGLGLPAIVALLLVVGAGIWFGLRRGGEAEPVRAEPAPAVEPPKAAPPAAPRPAEIAPPPAVVAAPPVTATPPANAPSADPAAAASDKVVVTIKLRPPDAKVYRKGKEIGESGVTIELAPGERRSFEVGKPGYVTRKLIVDGTKPEVFIGLRPEAGGAPE